MSVSNGKTIEAILFFNGILNIQMGILNERTSNYAVTSRKKMLGN